jgi:hypothetical protein
MDFELQADTSWCPVCDRAIAPRRIQIPVDALPNRHLQFQSHPPNTSSPLAPKPLAKTKNPPGSRLSRLANTGGLVNGTGRGLRRHERPQAQAAPVRMKEFIPLEPTPYYCSDQCRKQDIANELERLQLSQPHFAQYNPDFNIRDDDDPPPLHVPYNTPAEDIFSPPSPLFISSGTDSDSDSPHLNDASYSPRPPLASIAGYSAPSSSQTNVASATKRSSPRSRPRLLDALDRRSASSRGSTDSLCYSEPAQHPLLSRSLEGKILVPPIMSSLPIRPNRSSSHLSLPSNRRGSDATKVPSQRNHQRAEPSTLS